MASYHPAVIIGAVAGAVGLYYVSPLIWGKREKELSSQNLKKIHDIVKDQILKHNFPPPANFTFTDHNIQVITACEEMIEGNNLFSSNAMELEAQKVYSKFTKNYSVLTEKKLLKEKVTMNLFQQQACTELSIITDSSGFRKTPKSNLQTQKAYMQKLFEKVDFPKF